MTVAWPRASVNLVNGPPEKQVNATVVGSVALQDLTPIPLRKCHCSVTPILCDPYPCAIPALTPIPAIPDRYPPVSRSIAP